MRFTSPALRHLGPRPALASPRRCSPVEAAHRLAVTFLTAALLPLLIGHLAAAVASADLLGMDGGVAPPAGVVPGMGASRSPHAPPMVVGFNQAWLGRAYGWQWIHGWDEAEATRVLDGVAGAGATVVRMWLFEGLDPEGVLWDGAAVAPRPGVHPSARRSRPTGIDRRKLENLRTFLRLAAAREVKVYLTLFTGNVYLTARRRGGQPQRRAEWWNLLNDRYGVGQAWRQQVLAPVLEVCAQRRDAIFAVDLMNEGNALVRAGWFQGGWRGAARFVRTWRAAIRAALPVPVGMSYGHHDGIDAFLDQRLGPDDVDFYDVHMYDDSGTMTRGDTFARHVATCGRPVYVGEFGQGSEAIDDEVQRRAARNFLHNAHAAGVAAALGWRLIDERPGTHPQERHSFTRDGRWRPAYREVQRFTGAGAW